jgi:very-short-patch-repair endonuclease
MNITKCTDCGKNIQYTTRKPKTCAECKKPKKKPKRSGGKFPKNKNTTAEMNMFVALNSVLFGYDFINHGYYSFLLSPKYSPLQLDRYYPDLKLGFEYDGKQHDEFVKFIHKTKSNFEYYKACDALKDRGCKEKGVTLIRFDHKEKLNGQLVVDKIKVANPALYERLRKEGTLREEDF